MKDWIIEKHHFHSYKWYSVKDGEREIAECESLQDAELIVSLHNNAVKINKDNPQIVAESIQLTVETLKSIERYIRTADDIGFSVVKQVILGKCFLALNKLEEK
jgi:hypothetical protein